MDDAGAGTSYSWPGYNPRLPPVRVSQASVPSTSAFPGNFLRSAEWCPDGSCLLTSAEDHTFRLYHFSPTSHTTYTASPPSLPLLPPLAFPQPAPIPSYTWYPLASVYTPETYAFLASVRSQPLHLLDAATGKVRASYRIVDHRERVIAPWSLAWEPGTQGARVWCGCEDALEVFEMERPGEGRRVKIAGTRKGKQGQKGIISSLAFSPLEPSLLATASFSRTLSLHSTSSPYPVPSSSILTLPHSPTQVLFHPSGSTLYALFRGQPKREIWAWDVRMFADGREVRMPVGRGGAARGGGMQRMGGSVEPGGRWLAAGDEQGDVSIFDVLSGWAEDPAPIQIFKAHHDAIGSTSFHPSYPLLATVSGSRHFDAAPVSDDTGSVSSDSSLGDLTPSPISSGLPELTPSPPSSDDEDDEDMEEEEVREMDQAPIQRIVEYGEMVRRARPRVKEARLEVWKFVEEAAAEPGAGVQEEGAGAPGERPPVEAAAETVLQGTAGGGVTSEGGAEDMGMHDSAVEPVL